METGTESYTKIRVGPEPFCWWAVGGSDSLAGPARTRAPAFCLIFSCKPFQEVLV